VLSPWLIVGAALILGLSITFLAVENTRQARNSMVRNLLDRAGTLMWAMEGGARAGKGMRGVASYVQFMLEETAKRQDIVYMAIITSQGEIVAHSDRQRVGESLYPAQDMEGIGPYSGINWRMIRARDGSRIFEASRIFAPLPGFREHMGHGRPEPSPGRGRMMRSMGHGGRRSPRPGLISETSPRFSPPLAAPVPDSPQTLTRESFGEGAPPPLASGNELAIVTGLDMASYENALIAAERGTFFTAVLVGLLGFGGFISIYWAQTYKMSRRLLLDARAFTDEVINSLPLGLIILNASGGITHVNAVAEKLLGCGDADLTGLKMHELRGQNWTEIAERVEKGEAVLEEEHELLLPAVTDAGDMEEGLSVPVSVSASRIVNEEGEGLGMIYLLHDLREVKRLQAELRRSERLSTLGNMAARVAHEIRNPLSSIKGFATYLGSRHDDDADREAARTMIGEVDRLNRVVSELLEFSRPSNLNIADADLGDILERTIRLAEADARAGGVTLRFAYPDEARPSVRVSVDAERITQALLNLVLNAVQATEKGGSVTLSILSSQAGRAVITVADTGCGMAPDVLAQVFSPYFTTRTTGTGLGLSIVAKIVEDHHGEIRMSSIPGNGAIVTLCLPLSAGVEEISGGDGNA
jgi:two-component system sensor histidine kinase HydH